MFYNAKERTVSLRFVSQMTISSYRRKIWTLPLPFLESDTSLKRQNLPSVMANRREWDRLNQPAQIAVLCSSRVRFGVESRENVSSPTPFCGSRLCRQNLNRAPRQHRQLRRLRLIKSVLVRVRVRPKQIDKQTT